MTRIACRTRTRGSLWLYAFLAAAALLACLSLRAPAAEAAFPGQNGKIAFSRNQTAGDVYQVWSETPDGSDAMNLATVKTIGDPLYGGSPAFSADGKKIAFETNRDGNLEIYVMNANGTNQTRVTNNAGLDGHPAWSPDGQRITFESNRDGNLETYVINADGTGEQRLTNNAAADANPAWSPDGGQIAFDSNRNGNNFQIFTMGADGSCQTAITNGAAGSDQFPSYSPDAGKLVFMRNVLLITNIHVMSADGSGERQLTNSLGNGYPGFSPDGTKIAYSQQGVGGDQLRVMNADGSGDTAIPKPEGTADYHPDWGPLPQSITPPARTIRCGPPTGGGGSGGGEPIPTAPGGGGLPTATPPPAPAPPPTGAGDSAALAAALARERSRARAFRGCLVRAARHTRLDLAATRRGSLRARSLARRHLRRRRAAMRRRCVARHGRTPGRVTGLGAGAAVRREVVLSFRAPGTDRNRPPPARGYLVKQSTSPITDLRSFRRAQALCSGTCRFPITRVGEQVKLRITDLRPRTNYYYAIAARDNVSRRLGPRSGAVRVRTR